MGAIELAQSIADRLGAVPGVVAVVLGGSWARGAADPNSDIDLGIYYAPARPPSLDDLRTLAVELDDSHSGDVVTNFGDWGPWINGGGWLTIQGQRVDWIYRDLAKIRTIIDDCRNGKPQMFYQTGHPHGFYTPIYLGEIALCQPLYDPAKTLTELKALVLPYPPQLKQGIIHFMLWEASFALETSRKSALRGDVMHVAGGFFRCAACLAQVIHALNERYCINEKGAIKAAAAMPICPPDFEPIITRVLSHPGSRAAELTANLEALATLVEAVQNLVKEPS